MSRFTLLSALAMVTDGLGLVGLCPTIFNEPYHVCPPARPYRRDQSMAAWVEYRHRRQSARRRANLA